jgi:hypothetical protein
MLEEEARRQKTWIVELLFPGSPEDLSCDMPNLTLCENELLRSLGCENDVQVLLLHVNPLAFHPKLKWW